MRKLRSRAPAPKTADGTSSVTRASRPSLVVAALAFVLGASGCGHAPAAGGAPPAAPATSSPSQKGDVLVFVPDPRAKPASGRPWGAPVADPAVEKAVLNVLAAVGDGTAEAAGFFSPLAVGPALWKVLAQLDGGLANVGKPSFVLIPHPGGDSEKLDMRTFFAGDMAALLRSPAFRKIGHAFAGGQIRAADDGERHLFYAFVPFELAGRPVTISERGRDRLLVYLDERRRPMWMDVLSAYDAPARPGE